MALKAYNQPFKVMAVEGEVVLLGPGPFAGSFEPEAILASLDLLRAGAEEALKQRKVGEPDGQSDLAFDTPD
jgi:hypothetical protein